MDSNDRRAMRCALANKLIDHLSVIIGMCDLDTGDDSSKTIGLIRATAWQMANELSDRPCPVGIQEIPWDLKRR